MEKGNLIEIRPIKFKKWHDVDPTVDFARPTTLSVLVDGKTRKWATGLTEQDVEDLKKKGFGENISDVYIQNSNSYWKTQASKIKLLNVPFFLNKDLPHEFIKWKNLKESRYVANSKKEYDQGLWPDATHIIYDEEEFVEERASKAKQKKTAYAKLAKLSKPAKINLIKIISEKDASKSSDDYIDAEMDIIVDEKLTAFLKYSSMNKNELNIRSLIYDCYSKNIITKKGSAYLFLGDQLGYDLDSTVDFLLDPKNQELVIRMKEKCA